MNARRQSVTGAVRTRDSASRIEPLLARLSEMVDDVVVALDARSSDGTEEIAKKYGTVRRFDFDLDFLESVRTVLAMSQGDWIFMIDDDESLGDAWSADAVRELVDDRNAMQYWFPRRWLVPPGNTYLSIAPWYPDWQPRLVRNLPTLLTLPKKLHDPANLAGEHRFAAWLPIDHHKLLLENRAARESLVRGYLATNPENDCARHYLWETHCYETQSSSKRYEQIFRNGIPTVDAAHVADVRIVDGPETMRAGERYPVFCTIANRSHRTMTAQSEFVRHADTILTEHWFRGIVSAHTRYAFGSIRHKLPRTIEPGFQAGALVSVTAPAKAGYYLLQLDLFEENVAWYSLAPGHGEHPAVAVRVV